VNDVPLSDVFKALSDPTRRQILRRLSERNMTAGEIAEGFQISKPSISHHLTVLKHSGLVSDERQGQNIVYSINTTVFDEVVGWVYDLTQSSGTGGGNVDDE